MNVSRHDAGTMNCASRVCALFLAAITASMLPSFAAAQNDGGNAADAPTTSTEQYLYFSYSSSDQCTPGSSIVGIRGFVTLEEWALTGFMPTTGCAAEMACLFDGESDQCSDLGPTDVAYGYDAVLEDGSVYSCKSSNTPAEEDNCFMYGMDHCYQGSIHPSCHGGPFIATDLQDPTFFSNPSPEDQEAMENYWYFIYYADDQCTTNVVGMRAFVSEEIYSLPTVGDDISCEDAMACLLNQDGRSCQGRKGDANVTFSYETRDDKIHSCQGTLVDLGGKEECVIADPKDCTQSGVFPACHWRIVGAKFLAQNPGFVLGDFGDRGPPTSKPSDPPTSKPSDPTSAARSIFETALVAVLFSTLAMTISF